MKVYVPVLLSKSLDAYKSEGIYLDIGNNTKGLKLLEYGDIITPEIISRMLTPLWDNILLIDEEELDNKGCVLCFKQQEDDYSESGLRIRFKISYMFISFSSSRSDHKARHRKWIISAIDRIFEIHNTNRTNKLEPTESDYTMILDGIEIIALS